MPSSHLALFVNGKSRSLPEGCTVSGLVESLDLGERRFAIAINRDVVPRSSYPSRRLQTGDRVEILEAVGGG